MRRMFGHFRDGLRFAHEQMEGRGHGGRHDHHGRHGRHREGREGRVFDQGDLRFVILHLMEEKPRHGYELIKEIEDRLGGTYSPSPGVIYPTLTWLEELGYAAVTPSDGGRKLYSITDEGKAFLAANKAAVEAVFSRMAAAGAARASSHAPELVRAMENLKLAIRLRTSRGKLSPEELDAIATALDTAARAIERA